MRYNEHTARERAGAKSESERRMTNDELLTAIHRGEFDDSLAQIVDAVRERQNRVGRRMRVGDRVRFNGQTRPQYLIGVLGTVEKVNTTTVAVRPDQAVGKFRGGPIRVPMALIEAVETETV
jgi:hypothetical protein